MIGRTCLLRTADFRFINISENVDIFYSRTSAKEIGIGR